MLALRTLISCQAVDDNEVTVLLHSSGFIIRRNRVGSSEMHRSRDALLLAGVRAKSVISVAWHYRAR